LRRTPNGDGYEMRGARFSSIVAHYSLQVSVAKRKLEKTGSTEKNAVIASAAFSTPPETKGQRRNKAAT
jgi:hypothetical protein